MILNYLNKNKLMSFNSQFDIGITLIMQRLIQTSFKNENELKKYMIILISETNIL